VLPRIELFPRWELFKARARHARTRTIMVVYRPVLRLHDRLAGWAGIDPRDNYDRRDD
jgi:hypothetical protein